MDLAAELRADASAFEAAMKKGEKALEGLGDAAQKLNRELADAKKAMAGLDAAGKNVAKAMDSVGKATRNTALRESKADVAQLKVEYAKLVAEQKIAAIQAKALADAHKTAAAQARAEAAASRAQADAIRAQTAELQRQAAALRLQQVETRNATGATHQHNNALMQALKTAGELAVVYGTLRAASKAFATGINYNATLEGARLAIASVVSANEKVVDAQGKQIEGVEKLKVAQGQVAAIMEQLRLKAIETGMPIQVLVSGFQAAVAPAMASKLTLDQTKDVVIGLTNAMKAMNVPLDQQRQEIQDILNADIDRNSHVAKNLQLNTATLKLWKEQGTLAKNLLNLLKDYNVAAGEFKKTWAGATSVLKGNFEALMGMFTGEAFNVLKAEAHKLADIFSSPEAMEKAKDYGAALADGMRGALAVAHEIAALLDTTASGWLNLWRTVKGPEADQAFLSTRNRTFEEGLKALGSKTLNLKGVPKEDQRLFPKGSLRNAPFLPNLPVSTNFEDFRRLLPRDMSVEQRRELEGLFLRSQDAGESARMKALGMHHVGPDGRVTTGPGSGYSTTPAGGPGGGIDPKITEEARKQLQRELKIANAGVDRPEALRATIAVYEKFIGTVKKTGLNLADLQTDAEVARRELRQAIRDAAGKGVKLSFGKKLQADALGAMPDASEELRDERRAQEILDRTRDRWFVKAQGKSPDKLRADLAGIDAASAARMRDIGVGESLAMANFETDPTIALNKEIAIRQKAIEDEYNARRDAAEALAKTDADERMKQLREAEAFKREAEAQLRVDERVGRLQIAREEGEMRMQFAQQAAQAFASVMGSAIRGDKLTAGGLLRGAGGLAQTGLSMLGPKGAAVGLAVGFGTEIVASFFDAGDKLKDAASELTNAANLQRENAIQSASGAFDSASGNLRSFRTGLSGRLEDTRISIAELKGLITPEEAEKQRFEIEIKQLMAQEAVLQAEFDAAKQQLEAATMLKDAAWSLNDVVAKLGGRPQDLVPSVSTTLIPDIKTNLPPMQLAPSLPDPGYSPSYGTASVADEPPPIPPPRLDQNFPFDALRAAVNELIELRKTVASRGTERNPLVTEPPKNSPFDFAPRSFFLRGGGSGTTRGVSSGSRLPGLGRRGGQMVSG